MLSLLDVRDDKARESRIRRSLAKDGYRLRKCRRGYGGYGVVDLAHNFAVFGLNADTRGYDASLDDVEAWAA